MIINIISYCFLVMFLPFNFPSIWVVEQYGLRMCVLIGTGSTVLGICVRCLVNQNFYFLFTG